MRIHVELTPSALTPSGVGSESFKIKKDQRLRNPNLRLLTLRDRDDNTIDIVLDLYTLGLLGIAAASEAGL